MEAAKYAADLNQRSQAHISILNQNLAIQKAQIEADKAKGKLSDDQYIKLLKELSSRKVCCSNRESWCKNKKSYCCWLRRK